MHFSLSLLFFQAELETQEEEDNKGRGGRTEVGNDKMYNIR